MSIEGPKTGVARVVAWMDRLQRRISALGFGYAVLRKYGDDDGGREAALITYYGFLSIFPLLLLGVAILSRVLAADTELRHRLVVAIVPPTLQPSVESSLAAMPTSPVPFIVGLVGLLFAATGVVFSVYQTLNHVAAVPHRLRPGFAARYLRVLVVVAILLAGAVTVGALTVMVAALPELPLGRQALAALGSGLVVCAVLLAGARLLLARPAPVRALWPAAVLGATAVTVVLDLGATLLAMMATQAGLVYGSFATVAGMFALLYVVSRVLVLAAEVAAVHYGRLWPRALDPARPTAADARAQQLLAREQERIPAARVDVRLSGAPDERATASREPGSPRSMPGRWPGPAFREALSRPPTRRRRSPPR